MRCNQNRYRYFQFSYNYLVAFKVIPLRYRVRHLTFFFSTSAYFVNGNTDLTDN